MIEVLAALLCANAFVFLRVCKQNHAFEVLLGFAIFVNSKALRPANVPQIKRNSLASSMSDQLGVQVRSERQPKHRQADRSY